MPAFAHNEHRSNNGIQTLWVPSPPPLNLQIALLVTSLAGHGVCLLVIPKPSRCLETLNTPSPEFCPSSWESGVGIMRLALRGSHFFPGEKREGGRREGWGGKQGRKGNGLATNCTITTFSKRKNHSVLFFFLCAQYASRFCRQRCNSEAKKREGLGRTASGQQAKQGTCRG